MSAGSLATQSWHLIHRLSDRVSSAQECRPAHAPEVVCGGAGQRRHRGLEARGATALRRWRDAAVRHAEHHRLARQQARVLLRLAGDRHIDEANIPQQCPPAVPYIAHTQDDASGDAQEASLHQNLPRFRTCCEQLIRLRIGR